MKDKQLERVRQIASKISYQHYRLRVERDNKNANGRIFIQWIYDEECVITGEMKEWHCRKWYLSDHMLESEIVKTAFAGAIASAEHQCREKFRYQDVRIFNPHISLEAMMEMATRETTREDPIDEDMDFEALVEEGHQLMLQMVEKTKSMRSFTAEELSRKSKSSL